MSTLLFIFLNDLFLLFVRIRLSKLFMDSFYWRFSNQQHWSKKER